VRKLLAVFTALALAAIAVPAQSAAATNLLEITQVNPNVIKPLESLRVTANVKSRQIESVELWLSRNEVTDLTKIAQDVIPLSQAVVINNQVTINRSSMPNLNSGVYQLVLRSIDGRSVIGEQAIPIVVVANKLPSKNLAVLVPISVPPTSSEVSPIKTLLAAGIGEKVQWFIDSDTFNKLELTELNLAGSVAALAATNPDPNVASKYKLRRLLALSVTRAQADLAALLGAKPKVASWQQRHRLAGAGIRTAISANLNYVVSTANEAATKYQFGTKNLTEITVDPTLTNLLAATDNPIMIKQYVLAASALTDAAAIAPPIGWAPTFEMASAFFTATKSAPWLKLVTTDQIGAKLPARSTSNISGSAPVFSTRHLRNLDQVNRIWRSLNLTTLDSPAEKYQTAAVSTISSWWWLARPAGNKYTQEIKAELLTELNKLKISSRSKVVLPAATGSIPITISNQRESVAKIQVTGTALGTAVVRIDPINVEIPAGAKQIVELPIEVISAGSIYAQLLIQGSNGEDTSMTPTVLQIEVSQYRAVAQLIVFGAFGVLVLLSAISIRGRVKKRNEIGDNAAQKGGNESTS
jgi:hypothetical protein